MVHQVQRELQCLGDAYKRGVNVGDVRKSRPFQHGPPSSVKSIVECFGGLCGLTAMRCI